MRTVFIQASEANQRIMTQQFYRDQAARPDRNQDRQRSSSTEQDRHRRTRSSSPERDGRRSGRTSSPEQTSHRHRDDPDPFLTGMERVALERAQREERQARIAFLDQRSAPHTQPAPPQPQYTEMPPYGNAFGMTAYGMQPLKPAHANLYDMGMPSYMSQKKPYLPQGYYQQALPAPYGPAPYPTPFTASIAPQQQLPLERQIAGYVFYLVSRRLPGGGLAR